jgi:putative peptidoglycan lipid II flippase
MGRRTSARDLDGDRPSAALAPAGRAASLMAAGTALSRATGLVRTAALAAALGVTGLADAYNTANTIPNMLFMLVTGGTLSAVVLPMLARDDDPDRRREWAAVLGGAIVALTAAASVLLAVAAPLLARGFAVSRGGAEQEAFVAATAAWIALFAPQVVLYGLSVHAVAVLQAHGRLALAGFAPVATNLLTVVAVIGYLAAGGPQPPSLAGLGTEPLVVLGVGTTLGVGAMALLQWLGARRAMPGLGLRWAPRHPAVVELWQLGRWTLGYVVVNQLGLVVVMVLANAVEGGVAAYQWAFTIMQLPYAVVAVSLLSATYPRLAQAAADPVVYAQHMSTGLRLTAALLVPAGVGLAVLADPIAGLLLGYGAAAGAGAAFVAGALRWFALALVPFTLFQLLTRAFYARSDTRGPMLANVAVNLVNVAGALLAVALLDRPQARIAGLVVAYALSYVTGVAALALALVRRMPSAFAGVGRAMGTALLASAAMAAILAGAAAAWPPSSATPAPMTAIRTVVLAGLGLLAYLGAGLLLRSPELSLLRSRSRGAEPGPDLRSGGGRRTPPAG